MNKGIIGLLTLGLAFQSCSKPLPARLDLDVPVAINSSEPSFHKTEDGRVFLNWYESSNDSTSLKIAQYDGTSWGTPITVASGSNWFVNWADFSAMTSFGNHLALHYLEKTAEDTYAYQVRITTSNDQGNTWNTASTPHTDNTPTEHGFVSKIGLDKNRFLSVWLDGRQMAYAKEDSTQTAQMSLRAAIMDTKGEVIQESVIDQRTCDCCQTDLTNTPEGPIVVYRDRDNTEVRDIMYSRLQDHGEWTDPKPVYQDEWLIGGCPVNGPAISSFGQGVAVAWFTLATKVPEVKVAFSRNSGGQFEAPFNLGNTEAMGRVDIELLNQNTALVSWMETIDGRTLIKLQALRNDGKKSPEYIVTETTDSRSSGFPRMVLKDQRVLIAWTAVSEQHHVQAASIDLNEFKIQ